MESAADQNPGRDPRRAVQWAFWLGTPLIVVWLVVCAMFPELPELLFLQIAWRFLGFGLPLVALGLNLAVWWGVRRRLPWAGRLAGIRAVFCLLSFPWLLVVGFWAAFLMLLPVIGLPVMFAWGAEVTAEIFWIKAWMRLRRTRQVTA